MLKEVRKVFVAATLAAVLSLSVTALAQATGQGGGGQMGRNNQAQKGERHPVIRRAIQQLEHVRMELNNEAARDFQGHRAQAVKSIDEAIEHLKQALESDKR